MSVFHVVAEQLLLVRSMASPQRLEEGFPGLPGLPGVQGMPVLPGMQAGVGAAGATGQGQGPANGQGTASDPWVAETDPWEFAGNQRIPETPLTTPTTRSAARQQESGEQPWSRYVGALGRPQVNGPQQGYQQQQFPGQTGHILFGGCQGQQQQSVVTPQAAYTAPVHACGNPTVQQQNATEVSQLKNMVFALQQGMNQLFSLFRSAGPVAAAPVSGAMLGPQFGGQNPVNQQYLNGQGSQQFQNGQGNQQFQSGQLGPGLLNAPFGQQCPQPFGRQYGEEAERSPTALFGRNLEQGHSNSGLDVLSKTEKWLPGLPKPGHEGWKDRESEIVGFHDYLVELRSWASLVSPKFAAEISEATVTPQEIVLSSLSRDQQSRAGRLLSILRAAFSGHGRAENIIRAFCEGVSFGAGLSSVGFNDNGFELLRVLTKEFTLQSRAEALALRAELLQRQFMPAKGETSQGTIVADTIRRLETSLAKYNKLVSTLPNIVDRSGVEVSEADRLVLLLRSLPAACAEFVLLHSAQENYVMARETACRYETQRRLYLDWNSFGKPGKLIHSVAQAEVYDMAAGDGEGQEQGENMVDSVTGRCSKCGSKRHESHGCSVDLSKTRCFKCGDMGHVSMNCRKGGAANSTQKGSGQSANPGKGQQGSKGAGGSKGKGGKPSKGKGKEKGKSKGKGGKGKMFEVAQESTADQEDWWYQDGDGYWWTATSEWSEIAAVSGEPEKESSPAEQGKSAAVGSQPVTATLIAGLFSASFCFSNHLISNNNQNMPVKPVDFSFVHGSERLSAVSLFQNSVFPICFKVQGEQVFVDETFGQFCDLVTTCDEAWTVEIVHEMFSSHRLDLRAQGNLQGNHSSVAGCFRESWRRDWCMVESSQHGMVGSCETSVADFTTCFASVMDASDSKGLQGTEHVRTSEFLIFQGIMQVCNRGFMRNFRV